MVDGTTTRSRALKSRTQGPYLLDNAHHLMAQHRSRLHSGHGAPNHVQIGAADRAGSDADDGVRGLLDLRLRHIVQTNVANASGGAPDAFL
jgi:hypothetical protein